MTTPTERSLSGFMLNFSTAEAKNKQLYESKVIAMTNEGSFDHSGLDDEIMRSTGFEAEAQAEALKTMSLINPAGYYEAKQKALEEVKAAVRSAYLSTYKNMINYGMSDKEAKEKATKEGNKVKDMQMQQFKMRFTHGNDSTYQNQVVHKSKRYV